jgi:hypothetical protein
MKLFNRQPITISFLALLTMLSILVAPATAAAQSPDVAGGALAGAAQTSGVQLLSSDDAGISLEMVAPDYVIVDDNVDGAACQRIVMDGGADEYAQSAITGAPQLPLHTALIGAPPSGAATLTITEIESEVVRTDYIACPAPELAVDWDGLKTDGDQSSATYYVERDAEFDPAIYGRAQPYPEQPALLEEVGFMRSQRLARVVFSPFQINPVEKTLILHRRMVVNLNFDEAAAQRASATAASSPVQESPTFDRLLMSMLVNGEDARRWRSAPSTAAGIAAAEMTAAAPWRAPQQAWRVNIDADGLYRLGYDDLAAAGMELDAIVPDNLRVLVDGKEIAIQVDGAEDGSFDPGDQLIFYAEGTDDSPDERYAPVNVYWLTYGEKAGKRMETRPSVSSANISSAPGYMETLRLDSNLSYVSSLPMESGYDHWYSSKVTAAGQNSARSLDMPIVLDQLAPDIGEATVSMALAGNVKGRHHVKFYINNVEVHEAEWNGRTYQEMSATFDAALLKVGLNFIRLELINDTPNQSVDMVYIDWIQLDYPRKLVADDDPFFFTGAGPGAWSYDISGVSNSQAAVYDITNLYAVSRIDVTAQNNRLAFGDSQPDTRQYVIVAPDQLLTPAGVDVAVSTSLAHGGADYLMIAPRAFFSALQPLADYRAAQGYRVRVVDVQDIYDQFAYGRVSAEAIRDFLAYAYRNWTPPAPTFVLLVGDGNYDPKQYLPTSASTMIPPYLEMVDPDLGETAADNRFVSVAGNDNVPDMHLGRFPANTIDDVRAMVEKTIRYEEAPSGQEWQRNLLFVADDLEGGGGVFQNYSNAIADGVTTTLQGEMTPLVPRNSNKIKLYLDDNCPDGNPATACSQRIVDTINEGVLLVSYVGHGAKEYWAAEKLLARTSLQQLSNMDRLPIMLPMTCLEGFYHDAASDAASFGESIVRIPGRGAVASWSPTGFGLVSGHDYLEKGFLLAIFHYRFREIGVATTYGKMRLVTNGPSTRYDDLLDTFVLFGDPALRINYTPDDGVRRVFLPVVNN